MKHVEGKVVIKVDTQSKNQHTFANGTTIRIERGWNNLNYRDKSPVNGWVVSANGIPEGAEVLAHHNAFTETYQITSHTELSGAEIGATIRYYSIPEEQVFLWRDVDTWKPLRGFATGLRVFKPYTGMITGVEPEKIKDALYVTSGALSGKVVQTLKSCDYCIIFQDITGREGQVIRFRHSDDEEIEREEVILIHDAFTNMVNTQQLYIGLTPSDAKPVKKYLGDKYKKIRFHAR